MNEVATNVDPMQTFQEKVVEKLRGDIGEMLPDEALVKLVERAVDEQFFKERTVYVQYGNDTKKPSWFVEAIGEVATPLIKKTVEQYVADHEDVIKKALEDYLTEHNLTLLMVAAISQNMSSEIMNQAMNIMSQR